MSDKAKGFTKLIKDFNTTERKRESGQVNRWLERIRAKKQPKNELEKLDETLNFEE
jgi:hypothetical protein